MSRFIRVQVDYDGLIDEVFAYVTDPSPARNRRLVLTELEDALPESFNVRDLLDSMVLDGVDRREIVANVVTSLFSQLTAPAQSQAQHR